jgi:phenylacetate-coenzyme A ligase PaaK-like adenylate-forming protein
MSRRGARSLDVGIHRTLSLSVTQPLDELVASLNAFDPQFVNAYPSTAGALADEQLAGRLRLRLENLTTNSEPLTPELRERLERAFGTRPTDFYATTEGLFGSECDQGAMHLFDDMCIVENVDDDGAAVPPGEIGARLLVTNLFNRTQPLIRFEISDLVAVDPDPCPCGRSLMRLRSLEGRAEDVIRLAGIAVHPLQFAIVTADPDVREFQVVQEGEALRLRVALRDGSDGAEERLRERVRGRLSELGVPQPDVTVERVTDLERSPGGKLQVVVAAR